MEGAIERLKAFDKQGGYVNVVVETPKGSHVKYAYDPESGVTRMKQRLPEGMMFPFNFGFIPRTKAEDGDPLDILLLNEEPLFPGCVVKARLVGIIKAEQVEKNGEKVRNDRLVGVAVGDEAANSVPNVEFDKRTLVAAEYFFHTYNEPAGKKFRVLGKGGKKNALAIVRKSEEKQDRQGK